MNHINPIYHDRWEGNILLYTGMGREGDQSDEFMQNRTLKESDRNNINVLLFEVKRHNEYTFLGKVELAREPSSENQRDRNGRNRKVCIFPLRIIEEEYVLN
jgi:5-methylcytosine-specific restriction protein A